MAITCVFSPVNPKLYTTTTGTVAGAAATTNYQLVMVNPSGHTQVTNFKSDGAGAATVLVVPVVAGTYTWNIYPLLPASGANGTFSTSGHT